MSSPDRSAADLIQLMKDELVNLKGRRYKVEARLNAQMRELEILDREIAQTEGGLSAVQRLAGHEPSGTPSVAGVPIVAACEAIIRERGGEATVADIVATLQASGRLREGSRRSNYNTVASQMYRAKGRFQKVEGSIGLWRLSSALPLVRDPARGTPAATFGEVRRDELERAALGPNYDQLRFRTDLIVPAASIPPDKAEPAK